MPIKIIWGDDFAACDRAIEELITKIVDPSWASINLSRLDGADPIQAKQALEECQTAPFGNGGRIIFLKRSPICNNCPIDLTESFEKVIDLIPEKTYLILNNSNKPDKRLRTTKRIMELVKSNKASEKSYTMPPIWDSNGQRIFVQNTANDLGIKITESAAECMVASLGNDSSRITSELIKLSVFIQSKNNSTNTKEEKLITTDDVKSLTEGITTNSLKIGDSLIKGNIGEAISLIDALLNSGEPALRILATLTGQVRGCLWVKILDESGQKDPQIIAKTAGIGNPKRIYIMRKQIAGKSQENLIMLLNSLLEIEAFLKRGILPKHAFRDGLLTEKQTNSSP